jgi:hypothetical protein
MTLSHLELCMTAIVVGLTTVGLAGCGSDYPETVVVRGLVTVGGKPLKNARIIFFPENGNQASGEVVDGHYELRTFAPSDGAVPGKYRVTVSAVKILRGKPRDVKAPSGASPEAIRAIQMEAASEQLQWLAPQRYSTLQQTPLTATVEAGKENQIDFALDAK